MKPNRVLHILIVLFAAVYYVARIVIYYAVSTESTDTGVEMTDLESAVTGISFIAIGVLGLLSLPWFYRMRPWGFWGTIAISVYTIVFDIWGLVAIAPSAAAGIVPAVVLLVYVLVMKDAYLGTTKKDEKTAEEV